MSRILIVLVVLSAFMSCNKEDAPIPQTPIPDNIFGNVREIEVSPTDINTPDKGFMVISMQDALYKVQFNATTQAQSNATLFFENDTVLIKESREYGNFGVDAVAYNPVKPNAVIFTFSQGPKKIEGVFNANTSFGGTFGAQLISQWRKPNAPTEPTQQAFDDLMQFVGRYMDSNGNEPGITPTYLNVTVSRM